MMTRNVGKPRIGNRAETLRGLQSHWLGVALVLGYTGSLHAQTITATLSGGACSTDSFAVSSFLESVSVPGGGSSSAGSGASASSTQVLTITKPFEQCSTPILQALAEGRASGSLTIAVSEADWTSPFIVQIPKALIESDTLADETPSAPVETLQISYSSLTFEAPVAAPGSPSAPVEVTLNGCPQFGAQSWNLGVQLPASASRSSAGGAAGKAVFSNLSLTKSVDACSGVLLLAAHKGTAFSSVTVTTPASQTSPSAKITLEDAIVSSDQIATQTVGDPVETVSFAFKNVSVVYEGGSLP